MFLFGEVQILGGVSEEFIRNLEVMRVDGGNEDTTPDKIKVTIESASIRCTVRGW